MTEVVHYFTSKSAGIVAGILLLLVMLVPRAIPEDGPPLMTWKVVETAEDLHSGMPALLAGGAVAGGLALLCGLFLRNRFLAICYLILAGFAVVILYCAGVEPPVNIRVDSMASISETIWFLTSRVLFWAGWVIVGAFLVTTGVRSRLGSTAPTCIAQMIASVLFLGLFGMFAYERISAMIHMPDDLIPAVWWTTVTQGIAGGLLALAGLISLLHSFAFSTPSTETTRFARAIAHFGLIVLLANPMIAATARKPALDFFLLHLHPTVIFTCLAVIFLEGLIAFTSEVGALVYKPTIVYEV